MRDAFEYGSLVSRDLFVGREDVLQDLMLHISKQQTCIVYGDRRVGKSSLVYEAIRLYTEKHKKQKFFSLYIDLSTCMNSEDFIQLVSKMLDKELKKIQPLKTKFNDISNFIKSVRPIAKINQLTGDLEHSIDFTGGQESVTDSLDDIFDLIEAVAQTYQVLVILDEFHVISYWSDTERIQWQIRSKLQLRRHISYIFAGSSRKLISKLFSESSSALYRSGPFIYVENFIDSIELADWIESRFTLVKIKITGEAIKRILYVSRSHPYYTQKLCYTIWIEQEKQNSHEVNLIEVNQALEKILNAERHTFKDRLEKLSNNQQNALIGIAKSNLIDDKPSLKNINKYVPITKSSLQGAIKGLENLNDQIIIRSEKQLRLEDPFFELWLAQ